MGNSLHTVTTSKVYIFGDHEMETGEFIMALTAARSQLLRSQLTQAPPVRRSRPQTAEEEVPAKKGWFRRKG